MIRELWPYLLAFAAGSIFGALFSHPIKGVQKR
jgi:hypothetical protein